MTSRTAELTQHTHELPRYTRRTFGWPVFIVLGGVGTVMFFRVTSNPSMWMPLWLATGAGVVAVTLLAMFSALTVRVWPDRVEWAFGLGWPRWSVPLTEIRSVDPVRYSFWWGYGIRRTKSGVLYNVSGRHAVRLKLREGRVVSIGAEDARHLARVIEDARSGGQPAARRERAAAPELTHQWLTQRLIN